MGKSKKKMCLQSLSAFAVVQLCWLRGGGSAVAPGLQLWAQFCSQALGLCSQPCQLACWDVTSQKKVTLLLYEQGDFKSSEFRGWGFSSGTFRHVLVHLCSIFTSSLKFSQIAQVPLFMLHGRRISTPVVYSLRLTARPYKEKKCVFPETCFGIYYRMHPELKFWCCAWILSQIKPYCSNECWLSKGCVNPHIMSFVSLILLSSAALPTKIYITPA